MTYAALGWESSWVIGDGELRRATFLKHLVRTRQFVS